MTAPNEPKTHRTGDSHPIVDVWSRTESKYRRRATVLLLVNVFLFAGLGCVAYWLRTGVVFAPVADGYWEQLSATFRPTLDTQHTPLGLSVEPISIEEVPMMVPVLGLILAALVSIPILISILYRFPCSLPFLAVVGLVAVMPWLAIALLGSCALASVRPFRTRSRFVSGLIALLPVVLYFFMASRQASPAIDILANPADRVKIFAPLILALVASAVVMGMVLIIAHVVNYRPGAITPLLAVLFLTPAALFEFQVGRDELHYRLLERRFGAGALDTAVREDVRDLFERSVEAYMARNPRTPVRYDAASSQMELQWLLELDAEAKLMFARYQDDAFRAAERFIRLFPLSVYAPNALYIEGRALDMRVDLQQFRTRREIVFYDDFPSPRSREPWEKTIFNAPDSPMAVVAAVQLAKLDARDGHIDPAVKDLTNALARAPKAADGVSSAPSEHVLARRKPPYSSLEIPVERKLIEARQLLELLQHNRDPVCGDAPLVAWFNLDLRAHDFAVQIDKLVKKYARCDIHDNLCVRRARSLTDRPKRIEALNTCIGDFNARDDALPESLFLLATAYHDEGQIPEARKSLESLVHEFPETVWAEQGGRLLRQLDRTVTEREP